MDDLYGHYIADRYCDLDQEITDRFFQSPQRIKFSLASVSAAYVVLVAKSGSLYVYTREPLQFLLLIPSNRKVGSIERIVVSPNSNYVVLANHKAELFLQNISSIDGHLSDLSAYNKSLPEMKYIGTAKANVTCFYWSEDEVQLFFGDRNGNVSLISIGNFLKGNIFHATIHPILQLDTEIVQIDGFDLLLVVSTRTGCILCNTDREEFKQIGNRPRDGRFGACFVNKSIDEFLRGNVICARPGARFWQVDYGGTVKQTIQFKDALVKAAPSRPFEPAKKTETETNQKYLSQNVSSGKLMELRVDDESFLVTYTRTGIYVFDALNSKLVLWTDYFENICDVFIVKNSIYCITESNQGIAVGQFQIRHKVQVFESLIAGVDQGATKRFILENRNFLKSKAVAVIDSLRPKMEQTKELLIREQEYECLEIISNVAFRVDDTKSTNGGDQQLLQTVKRDPVGGPDKTTRTLIASALRNTFNLFSQARGGQPELIRANSGEVSLKSSVHRLELFKEITTNFTNGDSDAIVDQKKKFFTNRKFKKLSELLKSNEGEEGEAVKESKLLKNLFLIYKSSRMGNVNMVDRYAPMFDKLSLQEILVLLRKLESLMQENDYSELEARQNSTVILLDYLSPAAVINDAMDNETLEEVIDRYVLVNRTKDQTKCCQNCAFPLDIPGECLYFEFGSKLFEFLYVRKDVENYHKLMKNIPYLLHVFVKYYRDASNRDSYLQLLFILRTFSVANRLAGPDWSYLLDLLNELMTNSIIKCFNCNKWNSVAVPGVSLELPEEYSWNYMLNQAARFMNGAPLLKEVLKHSNAIRNGEISKQFFLKCMQTA